MLHRPKLITDSEQRHSPRLNESLAILSELDIDGEIAATQPNSQKRNNLFYCHECGMRYLVPTAKFCSNCGTIRLPLIPPSCKTPLTGTPGHGGKTTSEQPAGFLNDILNRFEQSTVNSCLFH
ncbi:uncharacterized protein DEA37_0010196 [Paragonimus westermani]|uniref:Uncharacterized protein n=1 Tax=Paragonimus westermani TaxID=34504 RepID=A0A5J4NBG6_9TREM|nr:uncharacterized protein DEA37_0010196 [Paragonimus westermani]